MKPDEYGIHEAGKRALAAFDKAAATIIREAFDPMPYQMPQQQWNARDTWGEPPRSGWDGLMGFMGRGNVRR